MPMDRRLYPPNWEAIARQIKDEVGWRCEGCGRLCIRPGEDPLAFMERIRTGRISECPVVQEFLEKPRRFLLTVAHLDHVPQNSDRRNLKAWCAPCHCRYDLSQMARKQYLKRERQGQLNLFTPEHFSGGNRCILPSNT